MNQPVYIARPAYSYRELLQLIELCDTVDELKVVQGLLKAEDMRYLPYEQETCKARIQARRRALCPRRRTLLQVWIGKLNVKRFSDNKA